MTDENDLFSPGYPIELLAQTPFAPDREALCAALGQRLGRVSVLEDGGADQTFVFQLHDFPVELDDATVSAQLAMVNNSIPVEPLKYADALEQSWDVDDPRSLLSACRHFMTMVNLMSSSLPQAVRRRIVAGGLLALLECVEADLIYWTPSGQLIDPGTFTARMAEPGQVANPTYGFLNVRFFNIADGDGEMVMDTLGAGALGLTDLQIHFRDLKPPDVAGLLYSVAAYLLEHGDVIDNGHTVQGLQPDDRWECLHEMSLLEPQRIVLDIDPGPDFSARGGTDRS